MNHHTAPVATLVNVCGESYSGTTMLELMLGNGPQSFSCGEVAFWYRPITEAHRQLRCGCGVDPCLVWMPFRDVPPHRFHGEVAQRLGVDLVTDSSKRLSWVVDANGWGAQGGWQVVNLAIWKSPLAHLHSHWKRGHSLTTALRRYRRYYTRLLHWGAPVLTVNYHRLAATPATELATICQRIGIAYFPGKECFWSRPSHSLFGNLRTRNQVGAAAGAIQDELVFPAEFLTAVDGLRGALESPPITALAEELETHDVGRTPPVHAGSQNGVRPPWWYYRQRFSESWRSLLGRYRAAKVGE